ncbi:hypothetical protein BG000_005011, partial [Podila horticola]
MCGQVLDLGLDLFGSMDELLELSTLDLSPATLVLTDSTLPPDQTLNTLGTIFNPGPCHLISWAIPNLFHKDRDRSLFLVGSFAAEKDH